MLIICCRNKVRGRAGMLFDVSLGRYYETGSLLHRTDARVKIILYMLFLVATFMVETAAGLALLGIVIMLQIIAAKIPLKVMKTTITPVLPIVIFIFILNLLTLRTGNILWEWKFIIITDYGVSRALLMASRLMSLVISTSLLLTLTTTPLRIADALESLLSPLKVIKVPVSELAMMMSIALRFIPTLINETRKIMNAQISRGADYDTGSFAGRIKGYVTVLIPLFISSFKRAEELAVAMDARCYISGVRRTKLNPLRICFKDITVAAVFVLVLSGIVVTDYILR